MDKQRTDGSDFGLTIRVMAVESQEPTSMAINFNVFTPDLFKARSNRRQTFLEFGFLHLHRDIPFFAELAEILYPNAKPAAFAAREKQVTRVLCE